MSANIDQEIHWSPEAAARVVAQIQVIGQAFNELTHLVSEDLDEKEQVVVRRALANMMGPLIAEILMPIEQKFPALKGSL